MATTTRRVFERFEVEDDDGRVYLVLECEYTVWSGEAQKNLMSTRPVRIYKQFEMEDRTRVLKRDEDTFELVRLNKIVRKL
jgi:hypothetical protein